MEQGGFKVIPRERRGAYRSLLRDLRRTLLSEIGARAVYDHIARRARDSELAALATELNREGVDLVSTVQTLILSMGGQPRRTSIRRRVLARLLVHSTRVTGARPALRLIRSAEDTVSRWYGDYALFLVKLGDHERAAAFEELRLVKQRRALILGAWVDNLSRGGDRRL